MSPIDAKSAPMRLIWLVERVCASPDSTSEGVSDTSRDTIALHLYCYSDTGVDITTEMIAPSQQRNCAVNPVADISIEMLTPAMASSLRSQQRRWHPHCNVNTCASQLGRGPGARISQAAPSSMKQPCSAHGKQNSSRRDGDSDGKHY